MSDGLEIGQVWKHVDGSRDLITDLTDTEVVTSEIAGPDGTGAIWSADRSQFLRGFRTTRSAFRSVHPAMVQAAPAPDRNFPGPGEAGTPSVAELEAAPSQHPADLKPRGVKAPMYLIPWGAVPPACVPPALEAAAKKCGRWPDGDEYRPACDGSGNFGEELFEYLIKAAHVKITDVARVFEHGAKKYARDNWRTFTWDQAARDEYFGAICRHLEAREEGEENDPDSGLPHAAHAACGALIWIWHEARS